MPRIGVWFGVAALVGCAGQTVAPPAPARAADAPSSLDYVVYASMADSAMPLVLAGYGATERSEVAVQLQ